MIDFDGLVLAACVGAFGTPVVYTTVAGQTFDTLADATPLMGIFERADKQVRLDRNGEWIDTARPTLGIRVSDLVSAGVDPAALPTAGETMLIEAQLYRINGAPPPDSAGHMQLTLMIVSDA